MKYFLALVLVGVSLTTFGQKKKKQPVLKGFVPVEVNGKTLYVAETETTTAQWIDFINYFKTQEILLPDDSVLIPNPFNTCVKNMFFDKRTLYRDTVWKNTKGKNEQTLVQCSRLPITGVTFEQAQRYCEYIGLKMSETATWPEAEGPEFRLATPEEYAAMLQNEFDRLEKSKSSFKKGNPFATGLNDHGCLMFNHRHNSWCESNIRLRSEYGYAVPMPVQTFFPDQFGVWDLQGNVAEMTSEKGVAVGGSCINSAAECQPGVVAKYNAPEYWLGFRVVAEFRKN